jgi:phosphatidylglycerophosphate synthase
VSNPYQPTARRPIADVFRRTANASVRWCVRAGVHPDAVSYASLVASAMAAACFWFAARRPWLLLVGPLLCDLRLWFNMLDGMVAVAAGKASRRGEILNDLPDRLSDVIVFAAVAESGLCHPALGYWAAIAAVLTAYVGTFAQAVGVRRQFGGWMSKPWRMVTLQAGAWATWAWLAATGRPGPGGGGTPLDLACIAVLLGCVQTIAVRLRRTLVELDAVPPRT